MKEITWEEIVKRDDIVGGELETQEDGEIFRGKISRIILKSDFVIIESEWVAKLDRNTAEWKLCQNQPFPINADLIKPSDMGDGRICFTIPLLGFGVIFPKGTSTLDPAKVKGLED
jgi:hypothetical protein